MADCSFDAVLADPPYGIRFMGAAWDGADIQRMTKTQASKRLRLDGRNCLESKAGAAGTYDFSRNQDFQAWCQQWAEAVFRVLKPGGTIIAAGGPRTHHRLMCGIEDAGFEIFDCICWLFGSGFPKSRNYSKELADLPWCACNVSDQFRPVDSSGPSGLVGTGIRTVDASVPLYGVTADKTVGPGADTGIASSSGTSAMKDGIENGIRNSDPEMFSVPQVAGSTESDKVTQDVGIPKAKPKALGDDVVDIKGAGASAVDTDFVPGNDLSGDISPTLPLVVPPASTPSGVAGAAESAPVSDRHAGLGAKDSPFVVASKLSAADGADVASGAPSKSDAASPLERDGLTGSQALTGTELPLVIRGVETNATMWAGFGNHASIVKQLAAEGKVVICKRCRRPKRPPVAQEGWGTALKPAVEFFVLARKPLDGTFAENALKHGVSGLWIDGGRIGHGSEVNLSAIQRQQVDNKWGGIAKSKIGHEVMKYKPSGRWPANLILLHSPDCVRRGVKKVKGDKREGGEGSRPGGFVDTGASKGEGRPNAALYGDANGAEEVDDWLCVEGCPVLELGRQSGESSGPWGKCTRQNPAIGFLAGNTRDGSGYTDMGTAARFFYCAKAHKKERNAGVLEYLPRCRSPRKRHQQDLSGQWAGRAVNHHPTVKALELCKYLATLLLPPKRETPRRILVPFAGSGSEMLGCLLAGWDEVIGFEKDRGYVAITEARLKWWQKAVEKYGTPLEPSAVLADSRPAPKSQAPVGQMEMF